jgi:hypothetical protein
MIICPHHCNLGGFTYHSRRLLSVMPPLVSIRNFFSLPDSALAQAACDGSELTTLDVVDSEHDDVGRGRDCFVRLIFIRHFDIRAKCESHPPCLGAFAAVIDVIRLSLIMTIDPRGRRESIPMTSMPFSRCRNQIISMSDSSQRVVHVYQALSCMCLRSFRGSHSSQPLRCAWSCHT